MRCRDSFTDGFIEVMLKGDEMTCGVVTRHARPTDHIRRLINVMLFLTGFLANGILPYIIRRRQLLLSVLGVKQDQLSSTIDLQLFNMNSGSIRFVFDTTQRQKMGILLHEILQGNYR